MKVDYCVVKRVMSLAVFLPILAWGQATLAPTVDRFPFHLVNLSGDVLDTSGAGTQFVNFSAHILRRSMATR